MADEKMTIINQLADVYAAAGEQCKSALFAFISGVNFGFAQAKKAAEKEQR